eukprot:1150557-Amorphochlora_amoeboformis.AAC.2
MGPFVRTILIKWRRCTKPRRRCRGFDSGGNFDCRKGGVCGVPDRKGVGLGWRRSRRNVEHDADSNDYRDNTPGRPACEDITSKRGYTP